MEIDELLFDILDELRTMNDKLDRIMGDGIYNSISDINDNLEDIIGDITHDNSLTDINRNLETIIEYTRIG